MNLGDLQFNKKQEYSDGKYSIFSFSGEKGKFRRLVCEQESICIFPFDLNENNQIRNVYVSKYHDYHTNSPETRCITKTFDSNRFESHYEALCDYLKQEFGIDNLELNDVYYLGKVKHTVPFSKEYRCYGINLSSISDSPEGFNLSLPQSELNNKLHSIEKIKFNRVISGEVNDSLSLSCALLLLSYLND
jgi:hypothetical protein